MTEQMPTPQGLVPSTPSPSPEVFDDEGRRIVRPDVLNFITLSTIASQTVKQTKLLQQLYEHEKDLAGDGLTRRMTLTITDKRMNLLLPELWQSFVIVNDGEKTLYLKINSLYTDEIPLKQGEAFPYDAKRHTIRRLYLYCDSGESTSIRLVGSY